jgi:hypothetical protein
MDHELEVRQLKRCADTTTFYMNLQHKLDICSIPFEKKFMFSYFLLKVTVAAHVTSRNRELLLDASQPRPNIFPQSYIKNGRNSSRTYALAIVSVNEQWLCSI